MALELGGLGAKDGIEFERLCALELAFRLLHGQLTSIAWERAGKKGEGVDFLAELPEGGTEKRSCKIFSGPSGRWTIASLAQARVLDAARQHLAAQNSCFVFCSANAAPELQTISDRARRYKDEPTNLRDAFEEGSSTWRIALSRLFTSWKLSEDDEHEVSLCIDMLSCFHAEIGPCGRDRKASLEREAMRVAEGEPARILQVLTATIWQARGQRVYADNLRTSLKENGFSLISLSPSVVTGAIEGLRHRFDQALRPYLLNDTLFPRPEIDRLKTWILNKDGSPLAVLHGNGGVGKSAATLQVGEFLENRQIPFLPIRLDLQRPEGTLSSFAKNGLELPTRDPAAALNALAGRHRTSLLVIDQLDAIRWTGQHASAALSICRELIAGATSFPRMRVLLVCRTFDLQDSLELKGIVGKERSEQVELSPLEGNVIDSVVSSFGADPKKLGLSDRDLLSRGDLLAAWRKLASEGKLVLPVGSSTNLLSTYWDYLPGKLSQKYHLSSTTLHRCLSEITSYLDVHGRLDAPRNLFPETEALSVLQSEGNLRAENNLIAFVHQSHLDFLVASRIYRETLKGKIFPLSWIKDREQDLFRRRQLHLLLELLRDANPSLHAATLRDVLTSKEVRFHLKHLVLNRLRGLTPSDVEQSLILNLLQDSSLRYLLVDRALAGPYSWFDVLDRSGWLEKSLRSEDENLIDETFEIFQRVGPERSIRVGELLSPWLKSSDPKWRQRIRTVLSPDPREESEVLFNWRLREIRNDPDFANHVASHELKGIAKKKPERAILILSELLDLAIAESNFEIEHTLIRVLSNLLVSRLISSDSSSSDIRHAATMAPNDAWANLIPRLEAWNAKANHLKKRIDASSTRYPPMEEYRFWKETSDIHISLHQLCVAAGRTLARVGQPFLKRLELLSHQYLHSNWLDRLVAESLAGGESTLADWAVRWLIESPTRLILGSYSYLAPKEAPARELLLEFSGHCSQSSFQLLEQIVLEHHDPREIRFARESLKERRSRKETTLEGEDTEEVLGERRSAMYWFGSSQYQLLSALCHNRLSSYALSVLGTWASKFGPIKPEKSPLMGGRVTSSLGENPERLSDRAWLSIVSRPQQSHKPGRGVWNEGSPARKTLTQNSIETLSSSLRQASKLEPGRFAKLALRFPQTIDSSWLSSILYSVSESSLTQEPSPRASSAAVTEVEAIISRWQDRLPEITFAQAFCFVVSKNPEVHWSHFVLERVAFLACEHPDPSADSPSLDGFNTTRGYATHTIARLLSSLPERLQLFLSTIEQLLLDAQPGVRTRVHEVCTAIATSNPQLALRLYISSCDHQDQRVLTSIDSTYMLLIFWESHSEEIRPIVEKMLSSDHEDGATFAAELCTYASFRGNIFTDLALKCKTDDSPHQKGIARAFSTIVLEDRDGATAAADRLIELFDAPNEAVRTAAVEMILRRGVLETSQAPRLVEAAVKSPSVSQLRDTLARDLGHSDQSLLPFKESILVLARNYLENSRQGPQRAIFDELSEPLLRLYDESEKDPGTRKICLDAWDMLLESGLWGTHKVLSRFD